MSPGLKYTLAVMGFFVFVSGMVIALFVSVWANLGPPDRSALARIAYESVNLLLFFALLLLLSCAWIVRRCFNAYIAAASLASEEAEIVLQANPGHRIEPQGASEIRRIIRTFNALAERYQVLQSDVEARIHGARADLEAEKDRLSALMADLTQSVLVCNSEGRILLYNNSARQLFGQPPPRPSAAGAGSFVGLGRSIFGIIDRQSIVHALETIHHRLERGEANLVAYFVTTARGGQLIRGHMAPVQDRQREITGFVLTIEDVTRRVESSNRRDILLRSLVEGTRSGLGNMRAAVETILDYPDLNLDRRTQLTRIIQEETVSLGAQLSRTLTEFAKDLNTTWLLEDVLGADLLAGISRKIDGKLGVATHIEALEESLWLKVDSYAIVQAITYIVSRLKADVGIQAAGLTLQAAGRFARLDVLWHGAPVDAETLRDWEQRPLIVDGEGSPLTLQEVVARHGGEVWCGADRAAQTAYVRLLVPTTEPEPIRNEPVAYEHRPEYYDFDLFQQLGQRPEFDQSPLTELNYTVFDTETTGLDPSGGDEIISIGAVRIVNGRILRHEAFDQLIDPRRPVSEPSIRIHGISPPMLHGQPTIERVLPLFFEFAEDTVLVAHNAAFDLRFFQMKEAQTGLKLTHPVLDTLLLSAVVQPNQTDHSLEAIASRLGVSVIGRHTALGDAIVTGEVLLKLIPLLAEQGIRTLKEAREAAQTTYYARVKY